MNLARALTLAAAVLAAGAARADDASEAAASAASDAWLKLVDAGQYGGSWDAAARYFKDAMGKADWEKALRGVRSPLGKVLSRKVTSRTYATSLPGAPDGKYVVIQYRTSFAKKDAAVETVTPMLDADGRWRVSGYYIR